MIEGGCLCGHVRYRLPPGPHPLYFCHCRQCRKAQGSAFAVSVPIARGALAITRGAASLKAFRSSPAKQRWFCGECGSPIYSEVDGGQFLRVRAGTLDDDTDLIPTAHIFVGDKAWWDCVDDTLPRHAGREPGRQA